MILKTLAFLTLTLLTVAASAQEVEYHDELVEAFGDELPKLITPSKPVALAYKPSSEQIKYEMKVDVSMDMMGMVIPRNDEYVVGMKLEQGDSGRLKVTTKILEMTAEMKTRGGSIRIDTRNPETDRVDSAFVPLEKIWRSLLKAKSEFGLSPNGLVKGFEAPKAIREAVGGDGGNYGISPDDLSTTFLIGIVDFPDKPLNVGDQWSMQVVISPLGTESTENLAQFLGLANVDDRRVAVIQLSNESVLEDGEGVVSDAENISKSVFLFDIEAGCLFKQFNVTESDMVMRIGENEMAQTTTGESVVQRIK